MRILICTNAWPPHFVGGAELVAHALAREWLALGHEVSVFAGDMFSALLRHAMEEGEQDGIPVFRVATRPEDFDAKSLAGAATAVDAHFEGLLRQFQPDVVHCHNLVGLSLRLPSLAADHGARVFVTLHDFWGICARNTLLCGNGQPCEDESACSSCLFPERDEDEVGIRLRMRRDLISLNLERVEAFIAPSAWLAARYGRSGIDSSRIRVIPNGVDTVQFVPLPRRHEDGQLSLIYAGHLAPHKGVHVVLQAMALARLPVVLHVVGEGPQEMALRLLAAQLGLKDRVRFRGRMQPSGMQHLFAQADAVVLASLWHENQPVCLMEGMASGLPVVASRVGGIPAMIQDGEEGFLVPPGDAQTMAEAFDRLALSGALRASMGERGRRRVEDRGYGHQAKAILSLFSSPCCDERSAKRPLAMVVGDRLAGMSSVARRIFSKGDHVIQPREWLTEQQMRSAQLVILCQKNGVLKRVAWLICGGVVNLSRLPIWLADWLRWRFSEIAKKRP